MEDYNDILWNAARDGNIEGVKTALDNGANINYPRPGVSIAFDTFISRNDLTGAF